MLCTKAVPGAAKWLLTRIFVVMIIDKLETEDRAVCCLVVFFFFSHALPFVSAGRWSSQLRKFSDICRRKM